MNSTNLQLFRPRLTHLESREVPAVFTVTSESADRTVAGSLPWAVDQANARGGFDEINFNVTLPPAPFPFYTQSVAFNLQAPLVLTDQVAIYGNYGFVYGYNLSNLIVLDAANGTTSSGSTIQNLRFSGAINSAIEIRPYSSNNWVQNNNFTCAAIHVLSDQNTIRSNRIGAVEDRDSAGYRYQQANHGIVVGEIETPATPWSGTLYRGNVIEDNEIGYDHVDSRRGIYGPFVVDSVGILLSAGAQENFVGANNKLAYCRVAGVGLLSSSTSRNVVFGNSVHDCPIGVLVSAGANGNVIGGELGGNYLGGRLHPVPEGVDFYTYEGHPEPISGVSLGDQRWGPAFNNLVAGNVIGLKADQSDIFRAYIDPRFTAPSFQTGVILDAGSRSNAVKGNIIANIELNGVLLRQAVGNHISGNWIGESAYGKLFGNGGFGIAADVGAELNNLAPNEFGFNLFGDIYLVPDSTGNVIG